MEKGVNPRGGRGNKTTLWTVLKYLNEGYPRSYILKSLNISIRRFYKIRKKLIEKGFLYSTGYPTNKGKEKGSQVIYTGSDIEGSVSDGTFIRLHRIQIRVPIIRRWGNFTKGKLVFFGRDGTSSYRVVKINEATIKIFKTSLTIYLPAFFASTQKEADEKMLKWFFEWVPIAEEQLYLSMRKTNGITPWEISKREYAKVGAKNAQIHVARGDLIHIKDEYGALRYVVDQSQGPEFEAVHPEHSHQDFRKFEIFYNDVRAGRYAALKDGVADLGETVVHLTKTTAAVVKLLQERGMFK